MKRILYRFLSLLLITALSLHVSSCKRFIDTDIRPPVATGEVIVRDNVFVLDSVNNDQLLVLEQGALVLKGNPTLRNGRIAASQLHVQELKPGDILLGYASATAPAGFAAKIINTSRQGSNIRIDYERPKLWDIFRRIDKVIPISLPTVGIKGNLEVPFQAKHGNTQLTEKGTFYVEAEYESQILFVFKSNDYEWSERRVEFNVKNTYKSSCSIAGEVAFTKQWNLACQDFKPKPLPLPLPVPIYVTPVFRVDADVKLAGEAEIAGEWIQTTQSTVLGFASYNEGPWQTTKKSKEEPVKFSPTLALNGKFEVGAAAGFDFFLYQIFPVDCDDKEEVRLSAGLKLRGLFGVEGRCNVLDQQKGLDVKGYVGVEAIAGLKAKLFGLLEAEPSGSDRITINTPTYNVNVSFCKKDSVIQDTPLPNQVEEASTSVSTADPHMTTFDRGRYDFMAVGEFVAAKSTTDNFQVQVRQAPYPSSTQVSVNTGIAMLVDNDRVCVYPGPSRLYVNNQAINLSFTEYPLSGGGSIQYTNGNLSIKNRNGDRIEVKLLSNDLDYFITPAKNRSGKLAGLFGNYDGNPSNDLVQANGTRISNTYRELYPAFADSWRITQNQSLFVYETGKTTDSYTDKNFPRSEIQLTASQRAAAEQTCRQAGVTDPDALEGCIVDVALTGNQTFVERAKQNQIISNAKSILSASNFSQYRNEFTLSADATVNGSTVLLNSKGTIGWNDAYLNRDGYETEIVLSVNAPTPCFPLFDINVIDNTAAGDPNQNYLRLSANAGKTQVELVNSGSQPQQHPVNLFDGNRHRIRIATTKALSGSQTMVRILIYIDNYEPLTINRSYASSSLAGYLYPLLKNETINCSNGQITIFGWSFKSQ